MTHLTPAAPAPATRAAGGKMTRNDVLALARSGDAWRAVPVCVQVLRQLPQDEEMRCQTAGLYARIGLRTPALEQLEALSERVKNMPAVRSLRTLADGLSDDRVSAGHLRRTCEHNLAAVRVDERMKREWLAQWISTLPARECFRATDGNVVIRAAGGGPAGPWIRFRDDLGQAARFTLPHRLPEAAGAAPRPYIMEGIDPPWLFRRVARETPRQADGYQPRLSVVQRDPAEFLDGLAVTDLRQELSEARVRCYIGEDATRRLGDDLRRSSASQIAGPCITLSTVRTPCAPTAEDALGRAMAAQAAEDKALRARVGELYSGRTVESWRQAFAGALSGNDRPLRVLIPTCRYSTYIRHSSADLAESFRAAGHEAMVLMEEDDQSRFSSVAYLRAVDEFRPDLVVLINYTRSHLDGVIPPSVPFVSWFQDSMPHQFSAEVARRLGPRDFLIGHLHPELFTQFEYPEARRELMPMVVSASKFHDGPVADGDAERYTCEIAYVSHHSETPDDMHARLMREAGTGTLAAQVFRRLEPRVREIALECDARGAYAELREAAAAQVRSSLLHDPDERMLTQIYRQYCLPLADRVVRHQTLEWAADIARRRNWRLHLYGRGWEKHPRLAPFARGELPHDDSLRAAYRCAAVNLHATINTPVHQRVMEGAMSGGLTICRLHRDGISRMIGAMFDAVIDESGPDTDRQFPGWPGYRIVDSPTATALLCQLQRLGAAPTEPCPAWLFVPPRMLEEHESQARRLIRGSTGLHELVGDVSELTFRDAAGLERLADRAVSDPAWRASRSTMVADRARAKMTCDLLARRIVSLVHAGMNAA